jgi:hypothetical protein
LEANILGIHKSDPPGKSQEKHWKEKGEGLNINKFPMRKIEPKGDGGLEESENEATDSGRLFIKAAASKPSCIIRYM